MHDRETSRTSAFKADRNGVSGTSDMHGNAARVAGVGRRTIEFKLRVGDYRVLCEFDVNQGRIYLHYVGHRREIYRRPN